MFYWGQSLSGIFINHVVIVDLTARKRHQHGDMTETEMADEPQELGTAADRLEAALERIAQRASLRTPEPVADPPDDTLSVPEIAARLDQLIGRLRAALDGPPRAALAESPNASLDESSRAELDGPPETE
jgi:hypothetical protein